MRTVLMGYSTTAWFISGALAGQRRVSPFAVFTSRKYSNPPVAAGNLTCHKPRATWVAGRKIDSCRRRVCT